MAEYIIIGVLVAAAVLLLALQIRRHVKGQSGGSCCGQNGCRSCQDHKE